MLDKFNFNALVKFEDNDFITQAYQSVLLREPDDGGRKCYLDALHNGTSKLQILLILRISEEGRMMNIRIKDFNINTIDINFLLNLDGQSFVEAAYISILGRSPSYQERNHYFNLVNINRADRIDFIYALRNSEEGKLLSVDIIGLDAYRNCHES